jgi:cell wall assembly regulator SMI1
VHGAVRAPEDPDVDGASSQELEDLERRLGRPLPAPLADWLRICRGAAIGPGGFFGNRSDRPALDIPACLELFPEWADKGWLPVAGDGCGNYYVLLPSGQVGFVDTISDSAAVQPDPHPDLYSCVEALLRGDQVADR